MKSNFFNRVVNLIAISKQKKIIEKNIIFFSMTFLEMAALFNFMFLMEMLIFFYKHQQKADHKESTGNPDHSDSIAYGQISTNAGTQGKHKDDSKIIPHFFKLKRLLKFLCEDQIVGRKIHTK